MVGNVGTSHWHVDGVAGLTARNGRRVDAFGRNRFYLAYGYSIRDNLRVQFGYMHQETDDIGKGQLQFNIFHSM